MAYMSNVGYRDSASLDSFSRLRVSNTYGLLDAQLTYNLQPLQFEQIKTANGGEAIAHDATNRCALMTFASTPTASRVMMQSYEHFRYQPGKSQLVFVTFNFIEAMANTLKFAGLSDWGSVSAGVGNGICFQLNGTTKQWTIYSDTGKGDETVAQSSWNLDKLDGTGSSGLTLDITKVQIAVIDFQALYVGRVRVGFDIGGTIVYCHQFLHANLDTTPYIQYANLPIRCGMTSSGTVSTTMRFICATVISEGGQDETGGVPFSVEGTVTAASGTDTHILSIQPAATFNSIVNRSVIVPDSVDIVVTGSNPVKWSIVVGQALTGASYSDVNATYSACKYLAGTATLSGSPAIVLQTGYCAASNQVRGQADTKVYTTVPITLSAAGAVRDLGTLMILVQGIGGTSATRAILNWHEHK